MFYNVTNFQSTFSQPRPKEGQSTRCSELVFEDKDKETAGWQQLSLKTQDLTIQKLNPQ